jgi:hypothetical protein
MRIIFILLALSTSAFGQIQVIAPVSSAGRSTSTQVISNIQDITITVQPNQYLGTNVAITANTNGATVTSWKWRIIYRYFHADGSADTLVRATSTAQNPTFALDSVGFYDVQLTARNSLDKYFVYESRLFVHQQTRFTRAQADIIVNMSTGSNTYLDKRGVDMSDKKIWIEGQTTNGFFECIDCHGRARHPLRVQKASDNTQVTIQFSGGSAHPFYFSQYSWDGSGNAIAGQAAGQGARYVIIDGFNLDGTPGIKVTGPSGSTVTVRFEGKLTDIGVYGIEVSANPLTIDGAAIAIVPTVASDCKKDNWSCDNLHAYRCLIQAGEEPIYFFESSQRTDYTGNHGFNPPNGIGNVICRNVCTASGRDGIQSAAGTEIEDNIVSNFGQQHDGGGQESCIVLNSGFHGTVKRNKCQNGEMFLNIASGEYAYAPMAGQSTPQPIIVEGNIYKSGTYGAGGTDETHAIYIQNNPNSGAGNWNLTFKNNTIDTDNKCAEMLLALGGYTSSNFTFANNIIISSGGNAGDTPEFNVTGNGKATLQSGTKTINDIFYTSYNSGLYFRDYSNGDFNITSLLSTAYSGIPTTLSVSVDYYGYPLPVPVTGYFFGAQGNYNKRIIAP